jgi:hypothetical protein
MRHVFSEGISIFLVKFDFDVIDGIRNEAD